MEGGGFVRCHRGWGWGWGWGNAVQTDAVVVRYCHTIVEHLGLLVVTIF